MAFVLLCLAYFTQPDTRSVHPCCCKWSESFLFTPESYFMEWMYRHVVFIHPPIDGHLLRAVLLGVGISMTVSIAMLQALCT